MGTCRKIQTSVFLSRMRAAAIAGLLMLAVMSETIVANEVAVSLNENTSFKSIGTIAGTNHGWQFTVNEEITLTHLGLFDERNDGFEIDYPIGLWRLSDLALLASGTIGAGTVNTLLDDFRYIEIADVALSIGEDYVIGFYSEFDSSDKVITIADELQIDPAINLIVGRWDVANQFQMPANEIVEDPPNPYYPDRFGPNFQFIPEPTTVLLLGSGGLLLRRRKSR